MTLNVRDIRRFQHLIFKHSLTHRRDFPWRKTRDPYAILVSEVMLQQTQAERVTPFFKAFLKTFPTARKSAEAPVSEVLKAWQGLGYNRRALNLKRAAEMIMGEYGGVFPKGLEEIDALPGVGPYTAGAIAVFAFNIPSVFIETNIRTVYLHFFFKGRTGVTDEQILELVERTMPTKEKARPPRLRHPSSTKEGRQTQHSHILQNVRMSPREWYNALMDYGAMLKSTVGNPNIHSAHYAKQSRFKGSRRELRGAILRQATHKGTITPADFADHPSNHTVDDIFTQLVTEGFLNKEGKVFKLAR